jgi:SAM-dependent methyltransferase
MHLEVPRDLHRGRHQTDAQWAASGSALLQLLARSFGRPDLGESSLLDVGCGTKFTKVILETGIPIGRYVGVDISADVISFLAANVHDPRFAFHHLDAHNDLYNPAGRPLESFTELPVGDERFDLVSLFSVFTHLAPHDYRAMLELLRPHVADDGGLLFSLFIDEGLDPAQRVAFNEELKRRREAGDVAVIRAIEARTAGGAEVPDFVDRVPDRPLLEAVYSEPYARRLVEGTGWEVLGLHPPQPSVVQHYFVCRPI